MATPSEQANLARIRDNQRRSRARRKEYLQELERRLRLCELQGVEASTEIQVAARKVVDENKKLRALLNKHGVDDDSIEAFLASGTLAPPGSAPLMDQLRPAAIGNNVQTLETLLEPRRPSCIDPSAPFHPAPPGVGGALGRPPGGPTGTSEASVATMTSSHALWDTGHSHGRVVPVPSNVPRQLGSLSAAQQYMPSPAGAVGSRADDTAAAMALHGLGAAMEGSGPSHPDMASPGGLGGHPSASQMFGYDVSELQNANPFVLSRQNHHQHQMPGFTGGASSTSHYVTIPAPTTSMGDDDSPLSDTDMLPNYVD